MAGHQEHVSATLAGMGQVKLAGERRAGKQRQIDTGSYQWGGEM